MRYLRQGKLGHFAAAAGLLLASVAPVVINGSASAVSLSRVLVRFDTMKASTGTTGTVCANPSQTATENSVDVTFPANFVLGAFGTFSVNTTNTAWPAGATAWIGITAPAGAGQVTGQTVNFASGDLTAGTLYCFNWTNVAAITNPGIANNNLVGSVTTNAAGGPIESGSYATAVVLDDTILVSASIDRTFSFALSANADNIGALSSSTVATSPTPVTATVNTNAVNGWYVWAKDTQAGLHSATASNTIPARTPGTNSTLTSGTDGYNTGVTSSQAGGSGSITVDTAFVGTSAAQGGGLDTNMRTLASSNGTASGAVLTLKNNATVSATTLPASDYTDTITVVGAGLF
jgi:hypothetical protein